MIRNPKIFGLKLPLPIDSTPGASFPLTGDVRNFLCIEKNHNLESRDKYIGITSSLEVFLAWK